MIIIQVYDRFMTYVSITSHKKFAYYAGENILEEIKPEREIFDQVRNCAEIFIELKYDICPLKQSNIIINKTIYASIF